MHREGRLGEAIATCRGVLARHPRLAEPAHLLGLLLIKEGALKDAEAALRTAVRLDPAYAAAWNDLGNLCSDQIRHDEARAAYRRAVELRPDFADAWFNLGTSLKQNECFDDAAEAFREVLKCDSGRTAAHRDLCAALRAAGRPEEMRLALETWLQQEPGQPVATHLLAALGGVQMPERASDRYVQHVFDQFADTFEQQLAQLEYRGPGLIAAALAEHVGPPRGELEVLDAGCGTGLCGPVLRPYAQKLTGVDLSPPMLELARGKGLFDSLEAAELLGYLECHEQRWDLIVACDTFNYFGRLDPLLKAAGRALKAGGRLVFTLEHDTCDSPAKEFRLTTTGRYCHSTARVETALFDANFSLRRFCDVMLRIEGGNPVAGMLIVAGGVGL